MSTPIDFLISEKVPVFPCEMFDEYFGRWWRKDSFPDAAAPGTYLRWRPLQPLEERIVGMTKGWAPTYNDPDNAMCKPEAEPIFAAKENNSTQNQNTKKS